MLLSLRWDRDREDPRQHTDNRRHRFAVPPFSQWYLHENLASVGESHTRSWREAVPGHLAGRQSLAASPHALLNVLAFACLIGSICGQGQYVSKHKKWFVSDRIRHLAFCASVNSTYIKRAKGAGFADNDRL